MTFLPRCAVCVWYLTHMSLKRTTVYVDSEDLALIKAAAARRGIPEAEIIREGVHLAAMASREWTEPFFDEPLDLGGPVTAEDVTSVAKEAAARRSRRRAA
ncbi:hypothetical protein GCM10009681_49870 [Luedemannella helvata]|uniref:Ribbon-helix-helix protein CopG domain-containing protein n=2 Tax=Luedemannella helvata TaxID=349315 RepID=A0ABP4XAS5_9ACTN